MKAILLYFALATGCAAQPAKLGQFFANPPPAAGGIPAPVFRWKMTEGSGTTVADSIGTNTGTLSSYCAWTNYGSLNAVYCAPHPSYIHGAGRITSLGGAANASMSCWVNITGGNATFGCPTGYTGYGGSSTLNFEATAWGGGTGTFISNGTKDFASTSTVLSGWHNVIVTYNAGTAALYIDGAAQTLSGGPFPSSLPASGSMIPFVGDDFQGDTGGFFCDFQIWNVTLTAAQAAAVYAKGAQQ